MKLVSPLVHSVRLLDRLDEFSEAMQEAQQDEDLPDVPYIVFDKYSKMREWLEDNDGGDVERNSDINGDWT